MATNKKLKDKNNVRHSLKYMQDIAKERGGKCLSKEYVNNKTPLTWVCEKKHVWSARPDRIIRGTWCIICAGKAKYNIGYCRQIAMKKNGECLSEEYVNVKSPLIWKCFKEHTWKNSLSGIINQNQWCPYCYGNVKHTIEDMKNLAKTNDGECLSNEYRGNKSKLTWKCKKGHIWEAKPNYVIMGHWCKICGMRRAGEKNKFTIGEVQNISKRHEGSLISKEYIDGKHKLEWVCKKGHVFFMTAPKANYGQWCPICAGRDKSERICRLFFEEIFDKKFPKVRPKWLISESGNRLELDGYCEELKLAFEFNGKQHYEFVGKFHKTRSLQETKKIDLKKRELCEINNVSLMIIPYTFKIKYLQEYIINRCKKLGIRLPSNIKIIDYKTINV